MNEKSKFALVAVEAPFFKPLTYIVPPELEEKVKRGTRVLVPLGKRQAKGVVQEINNAGPELGSELKGKLKSIAEVAMDPPLDESMMQWLNWLSQYYIHPPGQVFSMAFAPTAETRKRKKPKTSREVIDTYERKQALELNSHQKLATDTIINQTGFEAFLLFGVTGSGKTEVYLQSIESLLHKGKQALVLVPEISLTPQLIERFASRFGENVAVIHSHLTEREKSDQWQEALSGKKRILVGARSALFCPIPDLGLIIVDEEHDSSYKQDEQLKYHARDAAIMKARTLKCPIVMGSATPSLETWHNAQTGKFKMLQLPERVEKRPMPEVVIIDMRESKKESRDKFIPQWLSTKLYKELQEKLSNKQQVALFINRRGFAQFGLCSGCGYTESCPHCSVTLTLHGRGLKMICHYCGFTKVSPQICPKCREFTLKPIGLGTEKIKEEIEALFPQSRVARADRDEIDSRKSLEDFLNKVGAGEIDIIVGTQMIAKGHDFPNLTLVGTLAADMGLHFPDFRSSERTFQLLTQVSGRAGRHTQPGRVVIQTFMPEHPAIQFAAAHDYVGFASHALLERKELGYPPFGRLAVVRVQGQNLDKTQNAAQFVHEKLDDLKNKIDPKIELMGPVEAALAKLKNKYRQQVLVKSSSGATLNKFLLTFAAQSDQWPLAGISVSVDMDAQHLL